MIVWLIDWLTFIRNTKQDIHSNKNILERVGRIWLLACLIDWLIDWLIACLIDKIHWLDDWLSDIQFQNWEEHNRAGYTIVCLIDRLINLLIDWLTDWLTFNFQNWEEHNRAGYTIVWLFAWVLDWLMDWRTDWLTDWHWIFRIGRSTIEPATLALLDWMLDWLIGLLIGWLIDWLNSLIDWLIDIQLSELGGAQQGRVHRRLFCSSISSPHLNCWTHLYTVSQNIQYQYSNIQYLLPTSTVGLIYIQLVLQIYILTFQLQSISNQNI